MGRKSLLIVLALVVVLSFSTFVFAQEYWAYNSFTAQYERLKYKIVSYDYVDDYDTGESVLVETTQYQAMELRKIDEDTTEVTMAYTNFLSPKEVEENLAFMGGLFSFAMGGGEAFGELMFLGFFTQDLELEVGNNMQLFDGSRIKVVEKQTVAGVEGYFCTKSIREERDGKRVDVLTSELVIAPDVGWPLLIRVYKDEEVRYVMELVEYSRK